jgi:hypothetical protein
MPTTAMLQTSVHTPSAANAMYDVVTSAGNTCRMRDAVVRLEAANAMNGRTAP